MMWNDDVTLEIVNFSSFHIHTYISDLGIREGCFLICFYDQPVAARRGDSWHLLSRISKDINKQWCVLRDVN